MSRDISGPNNPNWKGGITRRRDGRVLLYSPDHPNAVRHGVTPYVLRSRLVAEDELGRHLTKSEVVHHVDDDPSRDVGDNLEVTTQPEHARHHTAGRARDPRNGRLIPAGVGVPATPANRVKTCVICGSSFEPDRRHRNRQQCCGQKCGHQLGARQAAATKSAARSAA